MSTLIETRVIDLQRVRRSRPADLRVATANAAPRSLCGTTLPTASPAPAYAAASSACGWQQMTETRGRGMFLADAFAQDGRLVDFDDTHVTAIKHSNRSGPPSCSPPA